MADTVIRVENLSKKYVIGHQKQERYTALRDVLAEKARSLGQIFSRNGQREDPTHEEFWALKDVSFEITQGDRVGIIGRNGAGKSTLLKILSRITEPTEGRISIKGRVASLLEVGTGFHPELTGRENIYLNGAILGMSKREIRRKFDEIVDFAEVEKFLDTPVKRYSSGMYVRLAFAVAAHLEPEILIVDEVLAVGDAQFQKKCLGKMEDVAEKEGRTVLFVSHNVAAIKSLCDIALYLDKGSPKYMGNVDRAFSVYLNSSSSNSTPYIKATEEKNTIAQVISVKVVNECDELSSQYIYDESIFIKFLLSFRQTVSNVYIAVHVHDSNMETILFTRDFSSIQDSLLERVAGEYIFSVAIPASTLVPGNYRVSIHIAFSSPPQLIDGMNHVCPFEIIDSNSENARRGFPWKGKVSIPLKWSKIQV
jgi:lipopolysaccharide transport system ATP-binding protein